MTGKPSGRRKQAVGPLLHRADIVSWHRAADHLFVELEAAAAWHRLDLQHHVAELAMAAGLLFVPAALGDRFPDPLLYLIAGLRFGIHAEAVPQPFKCDPQIISPCPHSTISWVRGLWIIVSDGSSCSAQQAWPSLTSSLRSVAESAIASTGGVAAMLTSAFGANSPLDSVSPVLMVSSLPSATMSPIGGGRLVSWAPLTGEYRTPARPHPMTTARRAVIEDAL